MRWRDRLRRLRSTLLEEINMLIEPINSELERNMLSYKARRISWQYGILGIFSVIANAISIILMYLQNSSAFETKVVQISLTIGLIGLLVLILLIWIDFRWFRLLICLLSLLMFIMFIENTLFPIFREDPSPEYPLTFYFILLAHSGNHWIMSSIINQEHQVFTIILPLEKSYFIARLFIESESTQIFQHLKAVSFFILEIFFLYYARGLTIQFFKNLINRENHESELVSLLDLNSPAPVYLFKIDQNKVAESLMRESEELSPLNGNINDLKNVFKSFNVEMFHSGSAEKKDVSSAEVLSLLAEIMWDDSSTIAVHKGQSQITLDDIIELNTEDTTRKFLREHIFNSNYEGKSAEEVVLGLFGEILTSNVSLNNFKFTLKDLNNNAILNHEEFKVYDISLMIQKIDKKSYFSVTVIDLSKRVISEEDEDDKPKGDIAISSVVHDMRAPLQAILGCSENLIYKLQKKFSHDTASIEACKKIKAYCSHLDQLANDILDSTRIKNSKLILNIAECDMVEVIEECIDLAKTIQNADKLTLEYFGPTVLIAKTDKHRLKRVLMNLLSNSVKNTNSGSITVRIKDVLQSQVTVSVVDTGKGISKEAQRFLFNPFNQYADNQNMQCVGLGLATAREMVGRLGPKKAIEVSSEVGQGSAFCFTLYRDIENRNKYDVNHQLVSLPIITWKQARPQRSGLAYRTKERAHSLIFGNTQIELAKQPVIPSDREIGKYTNRSPILSPNIPQMRTLKDYGLNKANDKYLNTQHKNDICLTKVIKEDLEISQDSLNIRRIKRTPSIVGMSSSVYRHKSPAKLEFSPNQKTRVFVLDDDLFNQEIVEGFIRRYFEEHGGKDENLDLQTCSRSDMALDIVTSEASKGSVYNLIITDFNLGEGKNGLEFANIVKTTYSKSKLEGPYIILASGTELDSKLSSSAFSDALVKPFTFDQFSSALNKWLEESH